MAGTMRSPGGRWLTAGLALAAALAGLAPGAAQELDAAHTRITARSDVTINVESGPGTSRSKLQELGGLLGARMPATRACYSQIMRERPTVQGDLRLRVFLEPGGGRVEMGRDETGDRELVRCVKEVFEATPFAQLRPPGSAYVRLAFRNTAAEGVARMEERAGEQAAVPVTRNDEGLLETSGGTPEGEVRFRLIGAEDATEAQLRSAHGTLRTRIALLLDCRRKAGRRQSPVGEVGLRMSIARTGRATARAQRSTVADDRGKRCLERGLRRVRFDPEARGTLSLVVSFAERSEGAGRSDE
ncbi:MAG: hypothetical protein AAGH15_01875 [Myxococcota bacterium]